MTDYERDVYALMGVSPLVKLEKDPKEFRGAIVKIVGIGEAPEASIELPVEMPVEMPLEEPVGAIESEPVEMVETVTKALEVRGRGRSRKIEPIVPKNEEISEPAIEIIEETPIVIEETITNPVEGETKEEDLEAAATVPRRRRRRSSAIEV
jgi:ribonuclease E